MNIRIATDIHSSPYPPIDVAVALAEDSHALIGSPPAASARLTFVVSLGTAKGWSAATRAAHAMREIDWASVSQHLDEPLEAVKRFDPVVLLARLREARMPAAVVAVVSPTVPTDRPRESGR